MKNGILLILGSFLLSCGGENGNNQANETKTYENTIKASITVNHLPRTVRVDFDESRAGLFEYVWSVRFDVNNDGLLGPGDIAFEIREKKQSGDVERSVSLTNLNAWLVQYFVNGSSAKTGLIDIEVYGNTLSFVIDRSSLEALNKISTMTQVYIHVHRDTPGVNSSDYIPELFTYTQVQDNREIIDDIADNRGTSNTSDISIFTLEIFE